MRRRNTAVSLSILLLPQEKLQAVTDEAAYNSFFSPDAKLYGEKKKSFFTSG